jgi:co-chaperonin GroES (HSP10)
MNIKGSTPKAVGTRVIIRPISLDRDGNEAKALTESGDYIYSGTSLVMPRSAVEKEINSSSIGEVIDIGRDSGWLNLKEGEEQEVKVGDIVAFAKWAGSRLPYFEDTYRTINSEDIVTVYHGVKSEDKK